jgi:NADPH:quinone reductase-like Zn-dependent oxidoreductase
LARGQQHGFTSAVTIALAGGFIVTERMPAELVGMVADGSLEIPIARTFPLTQVRDAYRELERRPTHGKIVLLP